MRSMTGYGVSQWKSSDCYIEVIVQTYNNKYFDSKIQLPPLYASLEGELRKELQKKITRGAINVSVNRSPAWPLKKNKVKWNKSQALKWKTLYKEMASSLKMKNEVSLFHLAQQQGVLEVISEPTLIPMKERNKLKALIYKAIDLCDKERKREGSALKKDFQKHLRELSLSIKKISSHAVKQNKKAQESVKNRMGSIGFVEEDKKLQEVTGSLINRLDICEEITRTEEHVRAFRSIVSTEGAIGKKMSFYLQELVREINTIGSKSQNFKLTKEVVQAKSLIERMREQVQNVE